MMNIKPFFLKIEILVFRAALYLILGTLLGICISAILSK